MNMTLREQHSLLRSGLKVVQGLGESLVSCRTVQWRGGLDKLTRLARLAFRAWIRLLAAAPIAVLAGSKGTNVASTKIGRAGCRKLWCHERKMIDQ